ncbi:MAG: hypothetical protein RLZZ299_760 [Pseudomonadota bacterium]|jgi:hypothetical protein
MQPTPALVAFLLLLNVACAASLYRDAVAAYPEALRAAVRVAFRVARRLERAARRTERARAARVRA